MFLNFEGKLFPTQKSLPNQTKWEDKKKKQKRESTVGYTPSKGWLTPKKELHES